MAILRLTDPMVIYFLTPCRSKRSRHNKAGLVYWYGDRFSERYPVAGLLYTHCCDVQKEEPEETEGTMV